MRLNIKVIPKSSLNKVIKISETELKVKLTSPPVDGEANKKLIEILSKEYNVAKSKIRIVRGETSKSKIVEIEM
ncbi:MAG: hypothetical protein ACD_18C00311G0009 [uncultured bacterium]|nr:MAG: hypothetical protein ACD_18C00311G0009 [uncultured bacterium]OGH90955.1 MAG: hypothetical protein A2507_05130 [Candidatus Magasanikbacteria bacterium RIFOXYD12_FULL_33_17]HAO52409.1 hypothetical protein [Candidatus Magasanikbacteria bacterium]